MLGSTTLIWIVIPLAVGLISLRRSEVALATPAGGGARK